MTEYRRPWWLIVNRPAGLVSKVREEPSPGERIFIVRGEPVVQGLAWLTWGPVAALVAVVLLAGLAISFEVREQSGLVRGLFIMAFLALPALSWGVMTIILNQFSEKYLKLERQALAEQCIIRLNQNQGELSYQTSARPDERKIAFDDIRQVRVSYPVGARQNGPPRLTIETDEGPITLLNETLGTQVQKVDLANEIQAELKRYSKQQTT